MNVLISGASVAGPALAYWLTRHGIQTTIVERADMVRAGGQPVDFRGTTMRVLGEMGILEELRARATRSGPRDVVDANGTRLGTMPKEVFAGDLEVPKEDLTRILYSVTKDSTDYLFGDSITAITEEASGVRVEFERNAPRKFDLVIGADGLHSHVRALAFGPEERFAEDMGFAFATFSMQNYLDLHDSGLFHLAGDRAAAIDLVGGGSEFTVFLMFPARNVPKSRDTQAAAAAAAFEDVGWELPTLLDGMRNASDFYFDELSQITMPTWSNGRVAVVGDAGYCSSPLSGRGTSQALLGAYALAGELATHSDHRAAFTEYERVLRGYVARHQQAARMTPGAFTAAPLSQGALDALSDTVTETGSVDDVALRDYSTGTHRALHD